jgi:Tfp pilus assembly protein PilW
MRRQDGFTVVELQVAALVGILVILAAFTLLDASSGLALRVGDRVDTTQRGREAMEQITRELRSQVCLVRGSAAIAVGQDSSVTFYAFTGRGTYAPEKHTIAWSATTKTLTDQSFVGTGTAPAIVYPGTPTRSHTLLSQVDQVAGTPIFSYYTWTTSGAVAPTLQLQAPLSATDAAKVVRIAVQFRVTPAGKSLSGETTTLQSEVFTRTADPDGAGGPGVGDCG